MFEDLKKHFMEGDPFATWWPFLVAGLVFLVTTIKGYMSGQYCPNGNHINDLIVIVTGANGGIGEEICKELSKRCAKVIMACKNPEEGDKAKKLILKQFPKARLDVKCLDLRSFENIRGFVKEVESEYDHVDILINNAGLTFNPYSKTRDGFETHLQVNYLGHFLLTSLLIGHLKEAEQGRIINVSAHAYAAGKMTIDDPLNIGTWAPAFHARDAFSHSKLAILMATRKLSKELKGSGITVNVCTPGLVRGTNHLRHSPIMKAITAKLIIYPWMWIFMKNAMMGAQTMVYLATDPVLKETTGQYFNDCEINDITEFAKEEEMADKLYDETLRALKIPRIQ